MTVSVLGPVLSRWQVELAALQTVDLWLETYLSEVERQTFNSTAVVIPRPPEPALQSVNDQGESSLLSTSIHGGVDFNTGDFDLMPEIILNVQPAGPPVYFGSGDYLQSYDLEIAAQVQGQDENLARLYADLYGAALMALIVQTSRIADATESPLGALVERVRLAKAPMTELMDLANTSDVWQAQSVSTFALSIYNAVNDWDGIAAPVDGDTLGTPDPTQQPPGTPDVLSVNVTVTPVDDTASLS